LNIRLFLKFLVFACVCAVGSAALAETSQAVWYYTVKPGDNLINIAKVHLLAPADWRRVQQLNGIKNPYKMPTGMVIKVPLAMVKHQPASAEVLAVSGQATLQKNAVQTPLSSGKQLSIGDTVSTGPNSSVTIRFADGSVTQLASNSVIVLDSMSLYSGGAMVDTRLRLQQGRLETHANPKAIKGNQMQITTPSAIAAVRGTEFRIAATDDKVTQETLVGLVDVESLGEVVNVAKGYGTMAESGKPPSKPVALLPAVDTVSFPKTLDKLPVAFEMPVLEGAVTWSGRITKDASHTQVLAERDSSSKQLIFDTLEDGQYYLSLRARDALGIAGYDASHAFVLNAQPFAPELQSPKANQLIRQATPVLQWRPSKQADFYVLQMARTPTFEPLLLDAQIKAMEYQINQPLEAGRYYWRVAAVTMHGHQSDQGPFAEAASFDFLPLPPTPDISALQVEVINNRIHIDTIPPPASMKYQVRLANPYNQQNEVWVGQSADGQIEMDLREFGPQQLYIQHVDALGEVGPAALVEFIALPQ
jgi:hypothetical protein